MAVPKILVQKGLQALGYIAKELRAGLPAGQAGVREIPKRRPVVAQKVAPMILKESQVIGSQAIDHYNKILKGIPNGTQKEKLMGELDEIWEQLGAPNRKKLDRSMRFLSDEKVNIRERNFPGITELPQIKPYGYWTVKLPNQEIKFGFSYQTLLDLSEKLTPLEKSKFMEDLWKALKAPAKPGELRPITKAIHITQDEITITLGNFKLKGPLWSDNVYTIQEFYK